jgi:probable F420-dependent oxidoreductase
VPDSALAIGCTLPISGTQLDPGALGDLAQTAEDLGYDSVWVADHVVVPERIDSAYPYSVDGAFQSRPTASYLEALSALAFLAGRTRRVRLGTHVLILPYRNPVLTAKMVTTIDNLSGGRVDFGVGVGWMKEEFEALGYDYYARRGAVTDEQIEVLKVLWTEDLPRFEGAFYRFGPLGALPHPVQKPHPPIWIGGHSTPALRRAATLGDGWMPIGLRPQPLLEPAELETKIAQLRTLTRQAGRSEDAVTISFTAPVVLTKTSAPGRPLLQGPPEVVAADLRQYQGLGVGNFNINLPAGSLSAQQEVMEQFMHEVVPLVPRE